MICGKHKYKDTRLYITIPNKKEYGLHLEEQVSDFRSGIIDTLIIRSEAYTPQLIRIEKDNTKYTLSCTTTISMDEEEYTQLENMLIRIAKKSNNEITNAFHNSSSSSALINNDSH